MSARTVLSPGKRYGSLVVIGSTPKSEWRLAKQSEHIFKCDCGCMKSITTRNVTSGKTRSCGCRKIVHGQFNLPGYRMWINARVRARKHSIPFTIMPCDITTPSHCPVLGIPLRSAQTGGGPRDGSPTLDRIIPSGGYTPGNIAVISQRANRIKNDATVDELRAVADWLEAVTSEGNAKK